MPAQDGARFKANHFLMGHVRHRGLGIFFLFCFAGAMPSIGLQFQIGAVAALVEAIHNAAIVRVEEFLGIGDVFIRIAAVGDKPSACGIVQVMKHLVGAIAGILRGRIVRKMDIGENGGDRVCPRQTHYGVSVSNRVPDKARRRRRGLVEMDDQLPGFFRRHRGKDEVQVAADQAFLGWLDRLGRDAWFGELTDRLAWILAGDDVHGDSIELGPLLRQAERDAKRPARGCIFSRGDGNFQYIVLCQSGRRQD